VLECAFFVEPVSRICLYVLWFRYCS